ncbi:anti-sigma factor family protein [Streptomyces alkaliphilus]|uniref:anti-sigma factor family protein n=1 Tax=Streptomyces alkaliphilus TaxID=1472722 RepID=UPI00117ED5C4|nr:hypothetical protein [Streptomyces alkaliphilus]
MTSEHHLGDRLAAFVDGELCIDDRERVLAHLATCAGCRAEADAQRRVKSYCAGSALPPPPPALLARLQGLSLPGPDAPTGEGPFAGPGAPPFSRPRLPSAGPAMPAAAPRSLPAADGAGVLRPPGHGFRIHRPEPVRGRGPRRFAFAAAGAFSLAAVAIGGVLGAGAVGSPGVPSASGPTPGASVAAGGNTAPAAGARPTAAREALRGVLGAGASSRSGQHRLDNAPLAGGFPGPTPYVGSSTSPDPPTPDPTPPRSGFVPVARAVTVPQPSPLPLPVVADMFADLPGSVDPYPVFPSVPIGSGSLGSPVPPNREDALRDPIPEHPLPVATAGHGGVPSPR